MGRDALLLWIGVAPSSGPAISGLKKETEDPMFAPGREPLFPAESSAVGWPQIPGERYDSENSPRNPWGPEREPLAKPGPGMGEQWLRTFRTDLGLPGS